MSEPALLRPSEAARQYGVSLSTLRRWGNEGKLSSVRTIGNQRRYGPPDPTANAKRKIAYCRVSSSKQKDDLERQRSRLQQAFPDHEIITDVGSGLNFKRKGLLRMVDAVMQGSVEQIVVAHRDRLCRFAFDLIQWICEQNGTTLVVQNHEIRSAEQELSEDLMAIVHVFSCRHHGMRRYGNSAMSKDQTQSNHSTGTRPENLDERSQGHLQHGTSSGQGSEGQTHIDIEEAGRDITKRGQSEGQENEGVDTGKHSGESGHRPDRCSQDIMGTIQGTEREESTQEETNSTVRQKKRRKCTPSKTVSSQHPKEVENMAPPVRDQVQA